MNLTKEWNLAIPLLSANEIVLQNPVLKLDSSKNFLHSIYLNNEEVK